MCLWYTVGKKMSDKNLEQWIIIKFCVKIGKSASASFLEWQRRLKEGRDVQDNTRSGQPKTRRTDANVDRVRTLMQSDRRLGVRLIAEELNMNRETDRLLRIIWE
jgi:hypothetical protein